MDTYQLNDGRNPIRFDKGNAAFYQRVRGTGEVRYTFSMIRFYQKHRPRLTDTERSALRKEQARKLIEKDPNYFSKIGKKGRQTPHVSRKTANYIQRGNRRYELPRPH